MKKFTFAIMALLALSFSLKAQQFVSTTPANRNVIIEEFTGRNCGYCPEGHAIANQIMANNPGRAWAINVHAGGYAPTSYPNFITTDGNAIHGGFTISGYPTGVVNRSTAAGQSRGVWTSLSNTELGQAAECNVAGQVLINSDTRVASITVEVYYTGNSAYDENYLTVAMLQDSIMGSQSGMSGNPAQVVGGQYCHMHILRDIITPSAWGEAIAPTTQGTLITKTYEYQIPESIGNPNGVEVVLDHIFFLAWVSERYQGTPTRPILNACELESAFMTNEPIYPIINAVQQVEAPSCSTVKSFDVDLTNIGTNDINSMRLNAQAGEVTGEFEWTGNFGSGDKLRYNFEMDLPIGIYNGILQIVEVNGEPYEYQTSFVAESQEWAEVVVSEATTSLKLYLIQDQYGEQTTWDIINSAGEVIAEGGPYQHLIGSGATQPNVENIHNVPADDCYMFRIYDSNGNGICCNYGNGYYYMKAADGHIMFGGEGNGDFGEKGTNSFSISGPSAAQVTTEDPRILNYNEVMFIGSLNGTAESVGFEYYKLVDHIVMEVEGALDGTVFTATVDDLEANTMYSVKAFAIVGGAKVYGDETHFHTWTEGVSELENTLKVYPNPANSYLTVEGEMTSVEVYNTVGQCMFNKQVNGNTQIDLSGFENGIYFLRVYNNGEMAVRKFSVNK